MSAKNKDNKNRWRNKTVAFRVSPEEWAQFETAVRLSGLSKQDYLIRRIQEREITVQGNPRVYKALRNELVAVLVELQALQKSEGNGMERMDELLETINLITTTLNGLNTEWRA